MGIVMSNQNKKRQSKRESADFDFRYLEQPGERQRSCSINSFINSGKKRRSSSSSSSSSNRSSNSIIPKKECRNLNSKKPNSVNSKVINHSFLHNSFCNVSFSFNSSLTWDEVNYCNKTFGGQSDQPPEMGVDAVEMWEMVATTSLFSASSAEVVMEFWLKVWEERGAVANHWTLGYEQENREEEEDEEEEEEEEEEVEEGEDDEAEGCTSVISPSEECETCCMSRWACLWWPRTTPRKEVRRDVSHGANPGWSEHVFQRCEVGRGVVPGERGEAEATSIPTLDFGPTFTAYLLSIVLIIIICL